MTAINPHENSATGRQPGLPARPGPCPQTTPWAPQIQQDQNAPVGMQAMHAQRVFALPEVEEWTGTVAHPRRAGDLAPTRSPPHRGCVPRHREIGHFHPWDGSLQPLLIFDSKLTTQAQSDPRTEAISFAKIGANTPVATDSWRNPTESG